MAAATLKRPCIPRHFDLPSQQDYELLDMLLTEKIDGTSLYELIFDEQEDFVHFGLGALAWPLWELVQFCSNKSNQSCPDGMAPTRLYTMVLCVEVQLEQFRTIMPVEWKAVLNMFVSCNPILAP